MIELVPDLRVINVLAKFENDPWKIGDVGVLTGLVCPSARPPARPLGRRQYPGALKGWGVKIEREWNETETETGNAKRLTSIQVPTTAIWRPTFRERITVPTNRMNSVRNQFQPRKGVI